MQLDVIAKIHTDIPTKFGLPRQSGVVPGLVGSIVFEKQYRSPDSLRSLEEFSHLWLIWEFSLPFASNKNENRRWSPTVRPPRLGGNTKIGVFATRSPNRPNPIGLSCVKIEKIEPNTVNGPIIYVSGIDMADGTPIYDIKPYLPHIDSIPDAFGGFAKQADGERLSVECASKLLDKLPAESREPLIALLANDPRPAYQSDNRIYGFPYAGFEVKFTVSGTVLNVAAIDKI